MKLRSVAESMVSTVLVGVVAVSCSAAPEPGSTAPSRSDRYGAPHVFSPRDLRGRDVDPCRHLLSESQLTGLGLPPQSAHFTSSVGVPDCTWTAEDDRILRLTAWTRHDYFVDTYRARLLPIFIPISVGTLPAVVQKSRPDAIDCTLTTGVADGQALDATWTELGRASGRSDADPCERAKAATEAVISNLPPLS